MKSFIVLTFGFLTVGFYELSGGSDFDPQDARDAAVFERMQDKAGENNSSIMFAKVQEPAIEIDPAINTQSVTAELEIDRPEVTRAVLNLAALDTVIAPVKEPVAPTQNLLTGEADAEVITPAALTGDAPKVVIPSLIFQGSSVSATSAAAPGARDVRAVTGNVVNVRGGPGTRFDVVNQLKLDAQVEILNDNGQGWVEMRPLDGGPTGWMADFLLSDG